MPETIDVALGPQTITVIPPDAVALMSPAERALVKANDLTIDSDSMYEIAVEMLQANKGTYNAIDEQRKKLTRPLDEFKAQVMNLFRRPLETRADVEAVLKRKIGAWQDHVADLRRKAEAAAAEERRRAEAKAAEESARITAEAEAKAAKLRQDAEAAAAAGRAGEAAKLAERADNVLDAGAAKVERVAVEAIASAPIVRIPDAPRAAGLSTATIYSAECDDLLALVKFIAGNPQFVNLVEPNTAAIRAQAKAMRDAFAIPGCNLIKSRQQRVGT